MTLPLMVYGMVVTCLLSAAAFFLDRGLRAMGRPTRWAWALGMTFAVIVPLASLFAAREPRAPAGGVSIPADLLYEIVAGGGVKDQGGSNFLQSLDGPLLLLWLVASAIILMVAFWTILRLSRAAKGWNRQRLGSEDFLISEGLGPAVLGFFRPKIILPPWVLKLQPEKLEMILVHEKEHKAARDPALLALGVLLVATTPWNPALWWMARRLHLAVEADCDARVLARGIRPKPYGQLLLEVASVGRRFSALTPALSEGGETFLERRLLMIRSTVGKNRRAAALVAMAASAGFMILACETPTPPSADQPDLALESEAVPAEVSEAEDGYFLVKKAAGEVEYVGPVSDDQLKLIREVTGEAPREAFVVRALTEEGPLAEIQEGDEAGRVIRIRENTGDAAGPKPLIIVDGVIVSDPNFMETLDRDMIDRIEVVKGAAAAALYGDRAAGGVIKIFTKH